MFSIDPLSFLKTLTLTLTLTLPASRRTAEAASSAGWYR